MKIAYCILCHKNNIILRTLIELLSKHNDVYVHIDAKADIEEFAEYRGQSFFVADRVLVKWGAFSMVEATLRLMHATCTKQYDYIFLLSGDDLPLKSDKQIKEWLSNHWGYEFIGVDQSANVDYRLKCLYPDNMYTQNKSLFNKLRYKLRVFKPNPYFKDLPKLYKGTQWFAITSELRDYILEYIDNSPQYMRAFERSMISDEVFFQTIVCNSEFRNRIHGFDDKVHDARMALRYMDWANGLKVLDAADYENMKSSDCLFARKMSEDIDIEQFKKYFELA